MKKVDYKKVVRIANRAVALYEEKGVETKFIDLIDIQMDLACCHETIPLDFNKLAGFDDFNLLHDISGIGRHLNRETRVIEDCFVPRCALT